MLAIFVSISTAGEVIIIVNESIPVDSLNKDEVKNIYLGNITEWEDKKKIEVLVLKDTQLHELFLKTYVKRNASQFKNVWKRNLFTGKGNTPKEFESIEKLLTYISMTKGTIGYVPTGTPISDNIKVVAQ